MLLQFPSSGIQCFYVSVFVDVLNNVTPFPEAPDLPYLSPDSCADKQSQVESFRFIIIILIATLPVSAYYVQNIYYLT